MLPRGLRRAAVHRASHRPKGERRRFTAIGVNLPSRCKPVTGGIGFSYTQHCWLTASQPGAIVLAAPPATIRIQANPALPAASQASTLLFDDVASPPHALPHPLRRLRPHEHRSGSPNSSTSRTPILASQSFPIGLPSRRRTLALLHCVRLCCPDWSLYQRGTAHQKNAIPPTTAPKGFPRGRQDRRYAF